MSWSQLLAWLELCLYTDDWSNSLHSYKKINTVKRASQVSQFYSIYLIRKFIQDDKIDKITACHDSKLLLEILCVLRVNLILFISVLFLYLTVVLAPFKNSSSFDKYIHSNSWQFYKQMICTLNLGRKLGLSSLKNGQELT